MKKILLVDDQISNHYVLKSLIEDLNFGVSKYVKSKLINAYSGKECLDILTTGGYTPDLIILDLDMPYMNGYELLGKIRKIKIFEDTFIFALSAHYEKNMRKSCINLGFNDYISKPYNALEMINYIKNQLKKKTKVKQ